MTLKRVLFLVLSLMTAGLLYAQQNSQDVVVDYLCRRLSSSKKICAGRYQG